jgi:hypothetical protein
VDDRVDYRGVSTLVEQQDEGAREEDSAVDRQLLWS